MVRSELIKRSPLRIFERSIHGGLGGGNIGVVASRKGVGKTACLVHIATDKLFQGKHVIHVSFSARVDHILNWYEDIFKEIAKKRNLESAVQVHDEIIKNRVIMNFNQEGVKTQQILRSVKAMIEDGHFNADSIIFDGFDFEKCTAEDLQAIREFATDCGVEVWFSVSPKADDEEYENSGIPGVLTSFLGQIEVLVSLRFQGDHVHLQLVKDRDEAESKDMHLRLDPKTLLIAEKS